MPGSPTSILHVLCIRKVWLLWPPPKPSEMPCDNAVSHQDPSPALLSSTPSVTETIPHARVSAVSLPPAPSHDDKQDSSLGVL